MEKQGHQSIGCGVKSCSFNDDHNACSLNEIQVDPIEQGDTGNPSDESMCGSYRKK